MCSKQVKKTAERIEKFPAEVYSIENRNAKPGLIFFNI
jgi:hypothetical protein